MASGILPNELELAETIREAADTGTRLAITGGGSKAGVGRDVDVQPLPLAAFAGVVEYDAAELVLTVLPATPLAEVQALVAGKGQMLAFEPFDHGPLFGQASGAATIGGVVSAGVAGARRVSAGGARDHLLGLRAVSGRGELFVAGAKVVKNVTGYDLPKLAAGSWGRLFAMTELTLKVLPRPDVSETHVITGLDASGAVRAMAMAMGSQAEVAAAAHHPGTREREALTAIRLEGFRPSVDARGRMLDGLLAPFGPVTTLSAAAAEAFWATHRTLALLPVDRALWRVNVAPSASAAIVAALAPYRPDWMMCWAGGLVWIAVDDDGGAMRAAAAKVGGHATLVRAPAPLRARIGAFHPPAPGLAALEGRVRRAFDPAGVFETGRF